MKHNILAAALLMCPLTLFAQETYQNAELMTEDLNGTARYVGMGGAMGALGADISVMSKNPAGMGMFRRTTVNVSAGLTNHRNLGNGDSRTIADFDQAGFVYSTAAAGRSGFFNFAFSYHRNTNFNEILSAAAGIESEHTSQNAITYYKWYDEVFTANPGDMITTNGFAGSQVDYMHLNTSLYTPSKVPGESGTFQYYDANGYSIDRDRSGWISEFDLNLSGNINDQVYLGLNVGIKDVRYRNNTTYKESILEKGLSAGDITMRDYREITGTGVDICFGIIVRPIEASPFRIGAAVTTPTWYTLLTKNTSSIKVNSNTVTYPDCSINEAYRFKLFTPWKFNFSLGTTVGNFLALGAEYEYSDYSSAATRIRETTVQTGRWRDYVYETSSKDNVANTHTSKSLRGLHTVKVGAEVKPLPQVAVRVGYNYVSPMYKTDAFRDLTLESRGTYYSSTTDFTNWSGTNRVTAGVGFILSAFTIDLAYQYSNTNGSFEPFHYDYKSARIVTDKLSLSDKRHQIVATLGCRF